MVALHETNARHTSQFCGESRVRAVCESGPARCAPAPPGGREARARACAGRHAIFGACPPRVWRAGAASPPEGGAASPYPPRGDIRGLGRQVRAGAVMSSCRRDDHDRVAQRRPEAGTQKKEVKEREDEKRSTALSSAPSTWVASAGLFTRAHSHLESSPRAPPTRGAPLTPPPSSPGARGAPSRSRSSPPRAP